MKRNENGRQGESWCCSYVDVPKSTENWKQKNEQSSEIQWNSVKFSEIKHLSNRKIALDHKTEEEVEKNTQK